MDFSFYIVVVFILFICLYLLSTVNKLNSRVKGLEFTLEQMSKQVDVAENPINNELRQLLKEGNDVKAVKRVREIWVLIVAEQLMTRNILLSRFQL